MTASLMISGLVLKYLKRFILAMIHRIMLKFTNQGFTLEAFLYS